MYIIMVSVEFPGPPFVMIYTCGNVYNPPTLVMIRLSCRMFLSNDGDGPHLLQIVCAVYFRRLKIGFRDRTVSGVNQQKLHTENPPHSNKANANHRGVGVQEPSVSEAVQPNGV